MNGGGFFPHDLDDIYEYKTDHQYFTHTGTFQQNEKIQISSDRDRNSIFRTHAAHSLDSGNVIGYRSRFDNTSFVRSLNESSLSPPEAKDKTNRQSNHSSLQEILKQLRKKVWQRGKSQDHSPHSVTNSLSSANDPQEHFRERSKSLDVSIPHRVLNDCGATYKIFDRIVKEGRTRRVRRRLQYIFLYLCTEKKIMRLDVKWASWQVKACNCVVVTRSREVFIFSLCCLALKRQ